MRISDWSSDVCSSDLPTPVSIFMIAGAAALFSSPSEATAASFAHLETCLAHRFRKAERKPAAGKGSRGLRLTPPKPYGPLMARTLNWPIFVEIGRAHV